VKFIDPKPAAEIAPRCDYDFGKVLWVKTFDSKSLPPYHLVPLHASSWIADSRHPASDGCRIIKHKEECFLRKLRRLRCQYRSEQTASLLATPLSLMETPGER
jgi:hypothetical protein